MFNSDSTRACIEAHWQLANQRDWPAFSRLLHPSLRYEVPQTREYLEGAPAYLDLFSTWPGDWQAQLRQLICEPDRAVSIIDFVVAGTSETGISIFELQDGLITRVTDYWPEPYEPPVRMTPHLKRWPAE